MTRRQFLWRAARYGSAAVMASLCALELLGKDSGGFRLSGRAPAGNKRRVIILGGGVAGLACAYELNKIGYDCTLLEARQRPGGRNWTLRGGTEETEIGNPRQVCRFDQGHFVNAGPMRISPQHETVLDYCRQFGIALVPFLNFNEAGYIYVDGKPRVRIREIDTDLRGYTAELLAKVMRKGQLDAPLTAEDREKFIAYLQGEGRLDKNLLYPRSGETSEYYAYLGHSRGYTRAVGADDGPGIPTAPLELETLLQAGYASLHPYEHDISQQETMLTPAGGIDRMPYAFADRLGGIIHYGAAVREVRRTAEGGVRVLYAEPSGKNGVREALGDFCICTLPPHLLAKLPVDFSPATTETLRLGHGDNAGKIGIQFKRRFWEQDDDIYGGRSVTNLPITQIFYPFDQLGSTGKGVVLGMYHFGGGAFENLAPAEREKEALAQGAKIHPQYPAEFENSFSVEWRRIPYNEGSWVSWASDADCAKMQQVLSAADGPFYFAGDWLSSLNGWQAGAFISAHTACRLLHARACAG